LEALAAGIAIVSAIAAAASAWIAVNTDVADLKRRLGELEGRTQHIGLHPQNYGVTTVQAGPYEYRFGDNGVFVIHQRGTEELSNKLLSHH
jgi:hypothetical protein